ncbi:MAG: hypothetical protein GC164_02590 [Phycisphaera sp.]|nr:hypothetical protein [Phycisphaera sp.]
MLSNPNVLLDDLVLLRDLANGFLVQRVGAQSYHMVAATHPSYRHEGDLTASQTGKLIGVVPVTGVVESIVLSVGTNIVSSTGTDGVTATASVNGSTLTTTHPAITSSAGSGFRCTAQGHGTASVIRTDGTQNVTRGSLLTVDLTRTAAGTVSTEAHNVVVMVVIRATQPM